MNQSLSKAKKFVLDLIFPIYCLNCGQEGAYLCQICQSSLILVPPTCFVCKKLSFPDRENGKNTCLNCQKNTKISFFASPLNYGDPKIRDLIHDLKYKRIKSIGNFLGDILADSLVKQKIIFPENIVVIPIPLHKKRERERGFNQSQIIGQVLSDRFALNLETKILFKQKETKPQMELTAEERKNNLKAAFLVKNKEKIQGFPILLVDDVKTTGSTLEEAAQVLRQSGIKKVWAVTVAH